MSNDKVRQDTISSRMKDMSEWMERKGIYEIGGSLIYVCVWVAKRLLVVAPPVNPV